MQTIYNPFVGVVIFCSISFQTHLFNNLSHLPIDTAPPHDDTTLMCLYYFGSRFGSFLFFIATLATYKEVAGWQPKNVGSKQDRYSAAYAVLSKWMHVSRTLADLEQALSKEKHFKAKV